MSEKKQKKIQNKNKNPGTLFHSIEKACDGLIYVSETDAPVLAFRGRAADDVSGKVIIQQTGSKTEETIEEVAFDSFFDHLTAEKDWFRDEQKEKAKKFLELKELLEENLRGLKVFRIGKIRLDIYIVGIAEDGCLTGVTTKAVET